MSTIKRKLEVAARAAMLAVFLISSLVPASVEARPSTAAGPAEAGSETGEGLPEARSDGTTMKYYSFAGQMIATLAPGASAGARDGTGLKYLLSDHPSTGSGQVWDP